MEDQAFEPATLYKVVVNAEQRYSIWPVELKTPAGWREIAKTGPKKDCLTFIKEFLGEMRPLSLRAQGYDIEFTD